MKKERAPSSGLMLYLGGLAIVATLLAGSAFGGATAVHGWVSEYGRAQREPTVLDQRIAAAQEIKSALARKIPRPEPLGPITAKVANPQGAKTASGPRKPRLSPEALNAMAQEAAPPSASYPAYDRAVGTW